MKKCFTLKELRGFKKIILEKINIAESDLKILRAACSNDSDNGTDDTSPTFKAFEEGPSSDRNFTF